MNIQYSKQFLLTLSGPINTPYLTHPKHLTSYILPLNILHFVCMFVPGSVCSERSDAQTPLGCTYNTLCKDLGYHYIEKFPWSQENILQSTSFISIFVHLKINSFDQQFLLLVISHLVLRQNLWSPPKSVETHRTKSFGTLWRMNETKWTFLFCFVLGFYFCGNRTSVLMVKSLEGEQSLVNY